MDVTAYNPTVAQNDDTPCIAAGGHNICKLARQGHKILAVSRDLRAPFLTKQGQYYNYPAKVYVESSNPSIQGCYILADTMNARFTRRIDLFFLNRKDNQGCMGKDKCTAVISNKLENCSPEFNQLNLTTL